MKIAVPVKFQRDNPPLSPLFGHAKWFAFIDDGKITIETNPHDGGLAVVEWLLHRGVDAVITQHIGIKPFALLSQNGVAIFYPGEGRILLSDALEGFRKGNLQAIDQNNIEKFVRHQGHA
ncbi:NifB/NifX family molybdenum-iron cluster-binding protein [Nitratiruptor tergarcus]|uniref:Predicted Fe-Mo cluster-binding protein, NifX family n=1 Tax=Nitratiruptor tergarcus DSM 16512 TaxID=1069081 RepID=A0A1W1WRB1_9BACT|nr:NifB/NifX family molybdenum-iron cluster-binding protein [Nitratiruptor tergarcus]SMC08827.1 Predicted Fe-Mo cluster-binding protein, NifX family [Nitratiruptor tergarcus DSM 16512]